MKTQCFFSSKPKYRKATVRYGILICTLAAVFSQNVSFAQWKKHQPVFELNEDNDFLVFFGSGSDRYYSNGTRLAIRYFKVNKRDRFLDKMMIRFKADSAKRYDWALTQAMFTPENIEKQVLDKGDWPYAGSLYVSHSVYSVNPKKNAGLRSEFYIGVLGPWSFAAETQIWVHTKLNYPIPRGWNWQIDNYPIINYNVSFEPEIYTTKYVDIIGSVESNAGSLMNQFRTGVKMRAGSKESYYAIPTKKFQYYLFSSFHGGFVLYNAYLEGGFFDRNRYTEGLSNGYRLDRSDISKFYIEGQLGVRVQLKNLGISYTQKYRTRQTKNTGSHSIGNVTVQIPLY